MVDLGPRLADDYFGSLKFGIERADHTKHALEFGVATGQTLKIIAERMAVTGFDSFEGLPEYWRKGFEKGMFAQAVPDVPEAEIVVGLFEDTLSDWINNNPEKVRNLGLVHIDCDLYSSTKTILNELGGYLTPGVIVIFDEYHGYPGWENHEYKAWKEAGIEHIILGHGPEQLVVEVI